MIFKRTFLVKATRNVLWKTGQIATKSNLKMKSIDFYVSSTLYLLSTALYSISTRKEKIEMNCVNSIL